MKNHFLNTRYLITETDPRQLRPAQAEITFIGRSNVGKSSLICALCEDKKLARVSKIPGRTRGINVFEVAHGRWLVDLPGYGFAVVPDKQKEYFPKMIERYLTGRPQLKCVFVLMDAEVGPSAADIAVVAWLREQKIPFSLIGTKVDRLSHTRQIESRAEMARALQFKPEEIFCVSAKHGYGIKELQREAASFLGFSK